MPNLVHLTDLHLDNHPGNLRAALRQLEGVDADVFLLGGDHAGAPALRQLVDVLQRGWPNAAIAWVAGNHDLWGKSYRHLWEGADDAPGVCLERDNLELPYCTVVGTYAHYDHRYGDPAFPESAYESFTDGRRVWNDRYIDRGGRTNPEIAAEVAERFAERCDAAWRRPLPVVVLTHVPPFASLNAWPRNFFSAYCVSGVVGDVILRQPNRPAALFCGHTHRPIRADELGFPMINTGSDYEQARITVWPMDDGSELRQCKGDSSS